MSNRVLISIKETMKNLFSKKKINVERSRPGEARHTPAPLPCPNIVTYIIFI